MSISRDNPEVLEEPAERNDGLQVGSAVQFPVKVYDEAGHMSAGIRLVEGLGQEFDAAQIQVILKNAEEIIKHALDLNKEACLSKLTQKETVIFGATITTRRSTDYDYSGTPLVAKSEADIKASQAKLKDLKEFLKKLAAEEVVDAATGEIFHKAKLTKDGILPAISLPK